MSSIEPYHDLMITFVPSHENNWDFVAFSLPISMATAAFWLLLKLLIVAPAQEYGIVDTIRSRFSTFSAQ